MSGNDLWKYCTSEQIRETICSFRLLDGMAIEKENEPACLYAVSNHTESHYHFVKIKKRNGKIRELLVPDLLLSTIQKNLLRYVLCEFRPSSYAHAYITGEDIVKNAAPHVGAAQILKLDICNFFEHITFPLIYQYAFPATRFPKEIRTLLTHLCCYKDYLPQGAPASPAISNLVMRPFDEYMGEWCRERKICYTRYCDDLTFSGRFDVKTVQNKVKSFLQVYGFELNSRKTRVQRQGVRQTVTGIVVNEKPQVSRIYRRQLRSEVYYCQKYGTKEHLKQVSAKKGIKDEKADAVKYLQCLLGKINFVLHANPEDNHARIEKNIILELLKKEMNRTMG